jgi:hypothetical protein
VTCDTTFHRGSTPNAGMNSAKIVVREIQAKHCVKVLPLLAETVRQSREPADTHSHCEVRTLND